MSEEKQREPTTLEELLKQKMHERQLSITALAHGAGITTQTLHRYLDGTRPNLESCRKLAFFLDVPLGKIIALSRQDVDEKELQSLIELYLELSEEERHIVANLLFYYVQHTKRRENDTTT